MSTLEATFDALPVAPVERTASAGEVLPPREEAAGLAGIDLLLRNPKRYLALVRASDSPADAARSLLLATLISAAALGAAVGANRGGLQIVLAAVKLPFVELLTCALCAPALSVLNMAVHGAADVRRDFVLVLTALAFGSLLASGMSPLLLLAAVRHVGYHSTVLLTLVICCVAGLPALSVFLTGLEGTDVAGRTLVGAVLVVLLAVVGAQSSWMLRPFIGYGGPHRAATAPMAVAAPAAPSWEICNGMDDDCDGYNENVPFRHRDSDFFQQMVTNGANAARDWRLIPRRGARP